MNKVLLVLFTILAGIVLTDCTKAQDTGSDNSGWNTWSIDKKDRSLPDELVTVDDSFRAKIAGENFHLKPLPPLKGRWGKNAYVVELGEVEANKLYCGTITLVGHHEKEVVIHGLSVSIIVENELIDLNFWPDLNKETDLINESVLNNESDLYKEYCTYVEGHAGHATARN